jgi:signal transduction histidine kinase
MEKQAMCRGQLEPIGSLRTIQTAFPAPEQLSAISRLITFICHDLRLPLTAILANAEFLSRPDTSEPERKELFEEIHCSVDRMNELVSSLFECSKDCDTFRPGIGNIVDTVESTIRLLSVRPEFRCITIEHRHRGVAVGWFDSSHLERAVANLILNACEAVSPESGLIVVTTIGNHNYLQITVWDNGSGIDPKIRNSLFQPFASYGKATGSGLGLAIVRKIVEEHSGEVYIDGKSETGTLFKITIPFTVPTQHSCGRNPDDTFKITSPDEQCHL